MDNISNGLGFGASSSDPKAAVMNQVRQEAAMTNARQLIEVHSPSSSFLFSSLTISRKSTNTASRSASRNPAPHYRAARRHASLNAWRNIWRRGTRYLDSTSTGYNRNREGVLVVVGFSKALVPRCTNDKAVGIGHVLYVCIQMGGKVKQNSMGL
jgi:hypothetical protein